MAKTRADLVNEVLEDINEAGTGQPTSAEDYDKVLNSLDDVFANLLGRNVVLQPIGDEIADEQFAPLTAVVIGRHARAFGLGSDPNIKAEADAGEKQLRTLARINRGSRNTLQVDQALRPRRWWGGYSRYPL